jgi:hypothetical protein
MASENTLDGALAALDGIFQDSGKRQQFVEDPEGTLGVAGYDPDDVPEQVWQALIHMSYQELTGIGDLGVALAQAGLLDGSHLWKHGV